MFEKKTAKEQEVKAKKEAGKNKKGQAAGKSIIKIVAVPLLITVILVAALYLVMDKAARQERLLETVVVASQSIRINAYISPDEVDSCFQEIMVDEAAVSDNAYTSLAELKQSGFYMSIPMEAGQMVYVGNIKKTEARLDKYLSGYETTSIAVSNFYKGVNGSIREGAVIDIYAVDPATDELTLYAEDVYVSAAYDSSGNELITDEGVAQSFTIYVKVSEIENMNKAINYGNIHIYQK